MKNLPSKIAVSMTITLLITFTSALNAQTIEKQKTVKVTNGKIMAAVSINDSIKVYHVIEQMPQFPGGKTALSNFIEENIKYPRSNAQGRVVVHFVVTSKGKVERAEVIRSLTTECDKEAIRVISMLPNFIPGKQNGENVAVWYTLPITFKIKDRLKSSVYQEHSFGEITDNTKPIYFIDEKPATEAEFKALNPQSIKELKVLKDAAATAPYGSRAIGGVVLITLKK